jgi:hypothetical protein
MIITDASALVKALMVSHVTGLRILLCMFLGIRFPPRVGCLILDFTLPLLLPLIEFTVT